MADYGVNETAAKNAATKAQTLIAERERAAQGPPPGKPQNWDGVSNAKRQRTIKDAQRDAQRAGNEAAERLMQFRRRVVDACRVLESWQPGDLELIRAVDEFADVTYGDIGSCLDDLITLELWLDRTRRTFTLYTDEDKVRTRILKLREQAAHPSTEPAEAAAYTTRAGKLERDLESRLEGGR